MEGESHFNVCQFCDRSCGESYRCRLCHKSYCGSCPSTSHQYTLNGILEREDVCVWCVRETLEDRMKDKRRGMEDKVLRSLRRLNRKDCKRIERKGRKRKGRGDNKKKKIGKESGNVAKKTGPKPKPRQPKD